VFIHNEDDEEWDHQDSCQGQDIRQVHWELTLNVKCKMKNLKCKNFF
jgi:hypothetical protein